MLNVGITFLKPIKDHFYVNSKRTQSLVYNLLKSQSFQAQTIVSYRYGTIFRTAIKGNIVEWCEVVERLESDVIVKFLGELIKESVPQLYHSCPYVVRIYLKCIDCS